MSTTNILDIVRKYPCREQVISELDDLLGYPSEPLPNAIYLYGHTGTGKSAIVSEFLESLPLKSVILNCIECFVNRILYETILDTFYNHELSKSNNYASCVRCDTMHIFIEHLRLLPLDASYVICLENAERLRDMDLNILPTFLRLQEVTGLNICTILISQLPFEKYYLKTGLVEVHTIYFPQYTKAEVQTILGNEFDSVKKYLRGKIKDEKSLKVLNSLESEFYDNYLSIFLNVFYRACRDLPELKMISRNCFQKYVEPVLDGSIESNDIGKLWRNISKPLSVALSSVYMRIDNPLEIDENTTFEGPQGVKRIVQSLELPFYTKYLLIAAYLASHNDAKLDRRLFVKNHGKQRKRVQTLSAQAKVAEKMQTNLGPKSFTIDRLLAIFYAIVDEKVPLTCNLLSQISTLVHLQLMAFVSGEANILEGSARLQCTVGLDIITHIGKQVGFNVRQYLSDFMH